MNSQTSSKSLGIQKGCLLSLLIYVCLFGIFYYFFHQYFSPYGDLIGSAVAALLLTFTIGCFRNIRLHRADLNLLKKSLQGVLPRDGETLAAIGKIILTGQEILTPFSKKPAVLFEYEAFVWVGGGKNSSKTKKVIYSGYRMVPSSIHTSAGNIKLLGFPSLNNPQVPDLETDEEFDFLEKSAREYLTKTNFEDLSGVKLKDSFKEISEVLTDDDGEIHKDWVMVKSPSYQALSYSENYIAPGDEVVVFGKYSASKRGLIPDLDNSSLNRLYRGSPEEVIKSIKTKIILYFVISIFFCLLIVGIYFGLTLEEKEILKQNSTSN